MAKATLLHVGPEAIIIHDGGNGGETDLMFPHLPTRGSKTRVLQEFDGLRESGVHFLARLNPVIAPGLETSSVTAPQMDDLIKRVDEVAPIVKSFFELLAGGGSTLQLAADIERFVKKGR